MKQRHRVRIALGASAALAVGAGVAFAAVPTPQPASQPVTHKPVSAAYSTTSTELATLRASPATMPDPAMCRSESDLTARTPYDN